MHILALSGSLRAGSSSTILLRAAAALAPPGVTVTLYDGLGDLPHFNPDLDAEGAEPPPAVREWRARLREADAVLVCSPEYAHGVPGTLKNALDWVVGTGELVGKPLGLLSASPRAVYARASLTETLSVMMAALVPDASVALPLPGHGVTEASLRADPALAAPLRSALSALAEAASPGSKDSPPPASNQA